MAENPAPTQSWCAHYPLALPINQQQSKQNVALQYRARSPSPQIISMGYAAHPCANCRRSVKPLTPTSKRPLVDTKQLRCLHLVELRRLVASQNVQKPHHTHTLKGFRPAHQIPRKGADATGQIVCYVIRTYRVLATKSRLLLAKVR